MRTKLLIATDNYLPRHDGISRFLSEIIPRINDMYEITVLAPAFKASENSISENLRVIRIPLGKRTVGDFPVAKIQPRTISQYVKQADIVFTQTIGPVGGLALFYAWKHKKSSAAYMHSIEWELIPMALKNYFLRTLGYPVSRKVSKYLYSKCSLLLLPAESVSEKIQWDMPDVKKRVVNLGCDTKIFCPPKDKKQAKHDLGIDPDSIVIGYHGRLSREKDIRTLLRGFMRVNRRHDKKLLVLGDGLTQIENMLNKPNVTLHGSVDNVVPFLQAMDIYILSSLTETTCLSILEAMSCGIPVITTPVGYVKDYVVEGKSGFFFDFRDAYSLAKKTEMLIEDPVKRSVIGKNAREMVVKRFSWEHTARELVDALDSLK